MKLRPLFILADLEAGGAQRVILTVIRHLNRLIFEPHLAIINKSGPMAKEIPKNVRIHDIKAERVRYSLQGILRLCRSIRPEVIVSTLGHLNLFLLVLKYFLAIKAHLIIREANTPDIRLRYTSYPLLYRYLYRTLYPLADRVICNSNFMKEDLVANFSLQTDKISVIPNPVDVERIGHIIRNSHNPCLKGKRHLVTVGRLNYQKGFDFLLKAFNKARQKAPSIHLTIVGDGPEKGSLRRLAVDLGVVDSVTFVGQQDNPFPFMAHADLFVSSSRYEGSPNAVLESLACGTPVLAFDCPGGTGEIIEEGKNGWLVPSEDWEAMSEKIVELMITEKFHELNIDLLLPRKYVCRSVVRMYEDVIIKSQSSL